MINVDKFELPKWYDENLMTLLVINPTTIYLYWELCFDQARIVQDKQMEINLYELNSETDEPGKSLIQKHMLPPFTGNWYFYELQSGRRYQAEICCKQNDRVFSIMKSNIVEVPPVGPFRGTKEIHWRLVEGLNASVKPAKVPSETVKEVINTMSFYMGIK